MKKALFSFLFIFGIFFSFYSFAETVPTIEKDSELIDIDIKYSFCFEYPISQEAAEICMDDFDPERFAVCSLYPRDAVAQAICLKDKSITARNVIDCSLAQTNMAEQYCLLNNPNLNTLDSIKTAIEENYRIYSTTPSRFRFRPGIFYISINSGISYHSR